MPRLFVYLFVQFVFKLRSKSEPLYFDLFLKLIPGGVTAITACAPAIKANQQEVSFAVANVVAFGTVGMLVYPYLAHSILGSSQAIGTFLGLAIHGMVPLSPDVLELIHGREQSGNGMAQSAIHQLAAAVFFMLSMYHGFVVCNLLWSTEKLPTGWKNSGIVGKFSFVVKSLTLAMQLLPAMTGLLYHPATLYILGIKGTLNESDQGGLAQWWTVGCLIFFYLTYSLDLILIGSHLNSSVDVKIKRNN